MRTSVLAASVAVGLVTLFYLSPVFTGYKPAVVDYWKTGAPGLDQILAFFTPFFVDVLENPPYIGRLSANLITNIFFGFLAVIAFESARGDARGPSSSFTLIYVLAQAVGASVAIPLFWLSSWLYSHPQAITSARLPPRSRLLRVGLGIFITGLALVSILLCSIDSVKYVFPFFLFMPAFVGLLWAPFALPPESPNPSKEDALESMITAQVIYGIFMLGTTVHYFATAYGFAVAQSNLSATTGAWIPSQIWQLLTTPASQMRVQDMPTYFILVDVISLIFTMAIFAFAEGGVSQVGAALIRTVLVGPGSAIIALASWREEQMRQRAVRDLGKTH